MTRQTLDDIAAGVFFIVITGIALLYLYTMGEYSPRTVRVDCSIAEISPDYPPEVKQKCRELIRDKQ